MGIAAYNRGTRVMRADIDSQQKSPEFRLLDALTEYSRKDAGARLLGPSIIRIDEKGCAWLMNKQKRGWGEYGLCYRSVWAVAKNWRLAFLSIDRDQHSIFYSVVPLSGGAQ